MSQPANMTAQAATGSTTWARCAKITTVDGLITALTEHDERLSIDLGDGDGVQTYEPEDAVELSTGRTSSDLSVGNFDIAGALASERITAEDLHAGRYEGAVVTMFEVDWQDPGAGQDIKLAGVIGKAETKGEEFVVEFRTWPALMSRNISMTIGPQCLHSFGSDASTARKPLTGCHVDLDPPEWAASTAYTAIKEGDRKVGDRVKPTSPNGRWYACTTAGTSGASEPSWPTTIGATVSDGTVTWTAEQALVFEGEVTAVTNRISFSASGIGVAEDFFARGWIEWLTGANADKGVKSPVATDDGAGVLKLYRPTIEPISIGDTFTIHAGCDKSQDACVGFSNWHNFSGQPYVPPPDV